MNSREILESRNSILAVSMIITLTMIVIEHILFQGDVVFYEYGVLPVLSLILGPYGVIGFIIIEIIYAIVGFGTTHIMGVLINAVVIFILGILPWKLWYDNPLGKDIEALNINSLYSFIKLTFIIAVFMLQYMFFFATNVKWFVNDIVSMQYATVLIGVILLVISIGIWGKYKIPYYTPRVQMKRFMPNTFHYAAIIIAIIIEIVIAILELYSNSGSLSIIVLILITIFLLKPFDDEALRLKTWMRLNIFSKITMSIFAILVIIAALLSVIYTNLIIHEMSSESFMKTFLMLFLNLLVLFIIPLLIYMLFLERRVIDPIQQLSSYLSKDIDTMEDFNTLQENLKNITVNNEIKSLSETLLSMEKELVDYGENLIRLTKERERYETELKLANEIQHSMIPTDFRQFIKNRNFSIWGFMKPAREVGGDFYDYFTIDEDHIGFVVGDVSGKGVSAALVMVKAMTSIQDFAKEFDDLSDVFGRVNNELCKGNVEDLFVTCWLAKLNIKTGELSYVNAGHNPPLISQDGGDYRIMDSDPGLVLAIIEDMPYEKHVLQLEPGDSIFLYTDGVTEANDNYHGFYGEKRLNDTLNMYKDDDLDNIIKAIEDDINDYCNNQEQFDDTTMFIIRYGK